MKISHQKGRKHVVIGPKPLSNHTRWCGLGDHAKRALEGGGSCAHLLATHPNVIAFRPWGSARGDPYVSKHLHQVEQITEDDALTLLREKLQSLEHQSKEILREYHDVQTHCAHLDKKPRQFTSHTEFVVDTPPLAYWAREQPVVVCMWCLMQETNHQALVRAWSAWATTRAIYRWSDVSHQVVAQFCQDVIHASLHDASLPFFFPTVSHAQWTALQRIFSLSRVFRSHPWLGYAGTTAAVPLYGSFVPQPPDFYNVSPDTAHVLSGNLFLPYYEFHAQEVATVKDHNVALFLDTWERVSNVSSPLSSMCV